MVARVFSRIAVVVAGLLLGVLAIEVGLRFVGLRPDEADPEGSYRRMHYIYTETGLGKCYPSDPHDYLPHDLRTQPDGAGLAPIIADVSDVPDTWEVGRKVGFLREKAPFCNNIELARLNQGSHDQRQRRALIIGDSFAFGEGLRLEDTLGFELAERYGDFNFPNMAWPGSSIETLFEVTKVPRDVEAVLYFYNINDVSRTIELIHRRDHLHDRIREAMMAGEDAVGTGASPYCTYSKLCWMLQLRRWEEQRSQATIEYYRELYFGEENREPRERTFDRIAEMKAALAERSIRFVVVMFPLYYKAPFGEYPFRGIHELVAAELARREVEFVDLLPAFEDYSSWYRFTVHPLDRHPSAEAIEVTADYLAQQVSF